MSLTTRRGLNRLGILFLGLGGWLSFCQPVFATRYVEFVISIDKKTVLVASTGDQGEDPDVVWRYLKDLPLRPVHGSGVRPHADNPARATLRGKVRIASTYGGEVGVAELKLVRDPKDRSVWKVAPAEVERTLKIRQKPK
jgi:hypothetical protein